MLNRLIIATALVATAATGCVHGSQKDERREAFEDEAEDRIDTMRDNAKSLEKRADQLLGEPKAQLTSAVEGLRQEIAQADAELREMRDRDEATWVEKKAAVDKELFEMDGAYNKALQVLQAH